MSEPFIGEIRMFGFSFAPRGWAACDGQELPIAQNSALFSILGTTYGGNGTTTFKLPDLRGRVPICATQDFPLGEAGGEEAHVLLPSEMPAHTHLMTAIDGPGINSSPEGGLLSAAARVYTEYAASTPMADMVLPVGDGQAHYNMQPYLVVNFCIALVGIFPSRN